MATISYAGAADREAIEQLLLEYDLGMAGDTGDYVVIRQAGEVCAAGKLLQMQSGCFHLEVLGVAGRLRKTGLGSLLLSELIRDPGQYCRSAAGRPDGNYSITTIARGEAEGFYRKHGFKPCSCSMLAPPYDSQCDGCPDLEACAPVPMIYLSR
jgi:N-acetylglutamate synthase-like GNAT family acetyltransferase